MTRRKILYLQRQSSGANSVESLQSALVSGAFDQEVSVLFRDRGVLQLTPSDDSLHSTVSDLVEYGIGNLYACRESMLRYGVRSSETVVPVRAIDLQTQKHLISIQDAVLND